MPNDKPLIRRGHNRDSAAMTSRLGDMLLRRRGQATSEVVAKSVDVLGGAVVPMPDEALPMSDLLGKARRIGRQARQTEYLHVSDLINRCMRRFALSESVGMTAPAQALSLWDSLTFAQGEAIHDVIKERVASADATSIWGNWRCACGTTVTTKPCTLAEVAGLRPCPACRTAVDRYVEVPMRDSELKIVGTPDLLHLLPAHRAMYVSELKSISHDQWKDLVRPHPDHVIQVLFYWYLMQRKRFTLMNRVSVVYITKGWQFSGQAWKEFTVDAQSEVEKGRLEIYLNYARELIAYRNGGPLPARIASCVTPQSPEAKKCSSCTACFGGANEKPVTMSITAALSRRKA